MSGPYDDILDLPHHVSPKRRPMPMGDRAAQFSPFAALTGYDDAITETGRLTDGQVELDEDERALLDLKIRYALDNLNDPPEMRITYFVKDKKKAGGAYVTEKGKPKKYDEIERIIVMENGTQICIGDVVSIDVDGYNTAEFLC